MNATERVTIRLSKRELRHLKVLSKDTNGFAACIRSLINEEVERRNNKEELGSLEKLCVKHFELFKQFLKDHCDGSETTFMKAEESAMEVIEGYE